MEVKNYKVKGKDVKVSIELSPLRNIHCQVFFRALDLLKTQVCAEEARVALNLWV